MPSNLDTAGLVQSRGLTRIGMSGAVIARNVEVYPFGSITKRPGYRRWLPVDMGRRVTCAFTISDKALIIGGNVDEEDA